MIRWSFPLLIALTFTILGPTRSVMACPMCGDAIPNNSAQEEADQLRVARAYNNSIYLMVGVPYFLMGTIGFMVYRHRRGQSVSDSAAVKEVEQPRSESEPGPR